jgi:hypothetical protein
VEVLSREEIDSRFEGQSFSEYDDIPGCTLIGWSNLPYSLNPDGSKNYVGQPRLLVDKRCFDFFTKDELIGQFSVYLTMHNLHDMGYGEIIYKSTFGFLDDIKKKVIPGYEIGLTQSNPDYLDKYENIVLGMSDGFRFSSAAQLCITAHNVLKETFQYYSRVLKEMKRMFDTQRGSSMTAIIESTDWSEKIGSIASNSFSLPYKATGNLSLAEKLEDAQKSLYELVFGSDIIPKFDVCSKIMEFKNPPKLDIMTAKTKEMIDFYNRLYDV